MSQPSVASNAAFSSMAEPVYRPTTTAMPTASLKNSVKLFTAADLSEDDNFRSIGLATRSPTMPISTNSAEETSLLGRRSLPAEVDDIELKGLQLQFPSARTLDKKAQLYQDEFIQTTRGYLLVAVQGDRSKPAIITYHDLGLNHVANFQAFFNFSEMRMLIENFCIYHVNAPGQEEGATTLPEGFIYPTMEELGDQLVDVMVHFNLRKFIGFGVGVGANIIVRFALTHPDKVDALCLLNCISTQAGWIEWGYQKLNARHLRSKGMTQGALDYLMWHHFGRLTEERNYDLVQVYRDYFEHHVNPANLALIIDSYIRRSDMNITREVDASGNTSVKTIKVPVLNLTGALSPHVDDTVTFNSRLDPSNSTWMKIQDCGMLLEEQPAKIVEAFRLFLQGNGYGMMQQNRFENLLEF